MIAFIMKNKIDGLVGHQTSSILTTLSPLDNDEYYISDLNDNDLKICKGKKIVSIDPGKNSLVYMADKDKNKLRYTASQRRIESLRKRVK